MLFSQGSCNMSDIPLKVLIVDPVQPSAEILYQALKGISKIVISVHHVTRLSEIWLNITDNDINTIYIDPISFHLGAASEIIFDIRQQFPSIVFVLYLDFAK